MKKKAYNVHERFFLEDVIDATPVVIIRYFSHILERK